MQMHWNFVFDCIFIIHTKCVTTCSLRVLHEQKGILQITFIVCTEGADFCKIAIRVVFLVTFSWSAFGYKHVPAVLLRCVCGFFRWTLIFGIYGLLLPSWAPELHKNWGIWIHVPGFLLKFSSSAWKFQFRDNHCSFPVMPCQMMAYGGAHAEGEDACSETSIGSLRVPNRSPKLAFRPANIRGLVVVDRLWQ